MRVSLTPLVQLARMAAECTPEAAAAFSAVLDDEPLLLRILGMGDHGPRDLASAAQVSRTWRRALASADSLWRAAWVHEAPCLRLKPVPGTGGSAGYRAALAQLYAAVTTARVGRQAAAQEAGATPRVRLQRDWALADFSFHVDVFWRGAPVFASARSVARLDAECFSDTDRFLCFDNFLPRVGDKRDAQAELCERLLRQPHTAEITAAELCMRLLIRRSDGALACLLDGVPCNKLERSVVAGTQRDNPVDFEHLEAFWNSEPPTATQYGLRVREPNAEGAPTYDVELEFVLDVNDERDMSVVLDEHGETALCEGDVQTGPFKGAYLALSWGFYGRKFRKSQLLWGLMHGNLHWEAAPASSDGGDGS